MTSKPGRYNLKIYMIEGRGWHRPVKMIWWIAIALVTLPLRFIPLFKPHKMVRQRYKVLTFRSLKECRLLNGKEISLVSKIRNRRKP